MAHRCPSCAGVLYNRRRETCEHCGAAVPEGLRLGAAEVEKLERIRDEDAARHRAALATLKARRRRSGVDDSWFDLDGEVWGADCDGGDCGGD